MLLALLYLILILNIYVHFVPNLSKSYIVMVFCLYLCVIFVKGTWILFQFLFLMQKSILYAKIAVSPKISFFQIHFWILYRPFIFIVVIM